MIMDDLSDAQVLLLAARLTSLSRLDSLRSLAGHRQDVLAIPILLRVVLTYLPLTILDPEVERHLVSLLQDIDSNFTNFSTIDGHDSDEFHDVPTSEQAEQSLKTFLLRELPIYDGATESDSLTNFLVAYIRMVADAGPIPVSTLALLDQFSSSHEVLRYWQDSFVRPLHLLQTEYYSQQPTTVSLRDLETVHGESGVALLLELAVQSKEAKRLLTDLGTVVSPWIEGSSYGKRRKIFASLSEAEVASKSSSWADVNKWLFSEAHKSYEFVAEGITDWAGPCPQEPSGEEHIAYIRTLLAMIYISDAPDDTNTISTKQSLLQTATSLAQFMPLDFNTAMPGIPDVGILSQASRSDLLDQTVLDADNQLTRPSTAVVDFLHGVLATQKLLAVYNIDSTTSGVTSTVLFDSSDKQASELRSILAQVPRLTRSNIAWKDVREQLLWLHSWGNDSGEGTCGYLGRIKRLQIDKEILEAILATSAYSDASSIYLDSHEQPLPLEQVQECVLGSILSSYDNASNGNKNRGGVKKAVETIHAFKAKLPAQKRFEEIEHLIKATHSLSFYQLTLQHGVPFQPVSIRVAKDPLNLIEKVLDQNNKAYAKLDDLIGIARNLVLAGLPVQSYTDYAPDEEVPLERRLFDAEHRVTYSAIIAALTDHDFDTAYSLITTRLGATQKSGDAYVDDTTWRAAYAAGRHHGKTTPQDIHAQIASLQKRMELLSQALTLAPPESLSEILQTWRKCEEELDQLKSMALNEERAIEAQSDTLIPGGFEVNTRDLDANETRRMLENRRTYNTSAPSYEEEAPMGLFDVARGAASALRKNAFPLRGAPGQAGTIRDFSRQSVESGRSSSEFERPGSADGQRVRKRDMLSNAVTGGLVSGMSWVLGAQPAPPTQPAQAQR